MRKHTPAPWTVREVISSNVPGQRAFAIDYNEDQEQVVDWVYEEADAHLIAAAPDLLEAIVKFREAFVIAAGDKSPFCKFALEPVDAAIAKARGEV